MLRPVPFPPALRSALISSGIVLTLVIGAVGCSTDDDKGSSTTTSIDDTGGSAPSTTSSTTAVPGTTSTTGAPVTDTSDDPAAALTAVVYWARPFGAPERIDLPAYTDADGAEHPYVLYGSVSNAGPGNASVPTVRATWRGADGEVVATANGRVVDPFGADLGALAAGATADFIVVVDDPTVGPLLDSIAPELEGVSS
jgi:hypothetical protein